MNVTEAVPAEVKPVSVRVIFELAPRSKLTVVPPCHVKVAALEGERVVVAVIVIGVFA